MNPKYFLNKFIYVNLYNGGIYQGEVIEVTFLMTTSFNVDIYMITIRDKYNKIVCFRNDEIKTLQEKG